MVGDERWAGSWGLRADFIAKTTCSVLFVSFHDVQAAANARDILHTSTIIEGAILNVLGLIYF